MNEKQPGKIENYIINNSRLKLCFADIESTIQEYCAMLPVNAPQSLTSQQYSGLCNYIGTKYFKSTGCLLCHEIVRKALFPTSGKMLIPELINKLLDVYVFLCQKYSKKVSKYDFSLFCGISYITLDRWYNEDINELNNTDVYINNINNNIIHDNDNDIDIDLSRVKDEKRIIMQKLYDHSRESYFNQLGDNKNAIAQIQYGRSKGYISAMEDERKNMQINVSLSAADLPKLTG